ncbi:unnamed protein product [Vicia faba]|uniref:Uncharacterized protein n=1 Tax=Vicia faba TaxID=3906 RepID=A0AAV0ZXT8_VICFA|nr:unnamed protein product [Vicia faba]
MAPVCTRSRMKLQKVMVEDRKQKRSYCHEFAREVISTCSVENTEVVVSDDHNKVEDREKNVTCASSGCCTPKAKRYRIPQVLTCPPAPKKRRVTSSGVCLSINRSPIALFSSPDIDLFFFSALKNVSV